MVAKLTHRYRILRLIATVPFLTVYLYHSRNQADPMHSNTPVSKRLCSAFFFIALLFTGAMAHAADLSAEEKVATDKLSDVDVERLLKVGSNEDRRRLFRQLTPDQKIAAFGHLDLEEKVLAFKLLNSTEKKTVFMALEDQVKPELFSRLEDADQELIFMGLEDRVKSEILAGMRDEQRQKWMSRYPGLRLMMPIETRTEPKTMVPPITVEEPSRIEKILSGAFPQTIDRELTQFGYDFFGFAPPTYKPFTDVPVGEDYILGPGDTFIIYLWGNVEDQYTVKITPEGAVIIPRLGSLTVAGLTLMETRRLLESKFREYYPDFSMSITMDELRSIQVFVIGEVQRPGAYLVSGLSTIVDALYAAGGPRKTGSLRNVKVARGAKELATMDLYTFLIDGRKIEDIRLRSGDTVLVPVIGGVAGVAGNVRRPGIYEMKGATTLRQLFEMAGGIMPTGHLQNVVVERMAANSRRIVKSFNMQDKPGVGQDQMDTLLVDGDVVKVFPIHRQMRQVVFLEGHVKYPREYEFREGMRVGDLVPSYDALLPEPFLPRAEVVRLTPPDLHPEIIEFDLGALLDGDAGQNIALREMDRIMVYDLAEKSNLPQVTINGAVRLPGTYRLYQGMRVKDLIFRAGSFLPSAYMENASLSRVSVGREITDVTAIDFSPSKAIAGNAQDDIELKPFDNIYIREIPRFNEVLERKLTVEGEFTFPGEYTFTEGERLSSVIERAGGLTKDAYLFGAVYIREDVKTLQKERLKEYVNQLEEDILTLTSQSAETSLEQEETAIILKTLAAKKQLLEKIRNSEPTGRMVVDLDKIIHAPQSEHDLKVQPGDRLIVKKRPDYVNVLGEVYNPTALLWTDNRTTGNYLNQVGGPNDNADEKQIYLVKANGTVISKRQEGFWGIATWDADNHRWALGSFENIEVEAGDTIIVPKQVEKYPWLRVVKSITEITFQIAVSAGILIAAF